jgi:hypothetical protein
MRNTLENAGVPYLNAIRSPGTGDADPVATSQTAEKIEKLITDNTAALVPGQAPSCQQIAKGASLWAECNRQDFKDSGCAHQG